ncbi:hypothetical protein ACNF42_07820 [Cuniculiplasma sp. SKW3]|uniref:hypothetical protein n=1 Tax=Cuniculiplasma sp. SKW3 TaxID=3400170 RepID=UPI003FD5AFC6
MSNSNRSDFIAIFGVVLLYFLVWIAVLILCIKIVQDNPYIGIVSIVLLMPIAFLILGMKFRQIFNFFRTCSGRNSR